MSFSFRLCGCLVLAALAGRAAAEASIRLSPEQAARAGVETAAVAEMKSGGGLRLPAQVVVPPSQIEVVAAPLPAMVAAVGAAYGEAVRKGSVLARLQSPALLELQRELVDADVQAGLAAENLKRDESLHADGIIAQSRLSATRAAARQAEARLAERRQALRLLGAAGTGDAALSGSAVVRAPFDAVVLEAEARPGSRVDAAAPLFKLGRLAPLWLEIQASPAQAAGVARGDAVRIAGCARGGEVVLVAPHMQAASQSLLIRAELRRPDGCVRPFEYVQAEIESARPLPPGAWRIPPQALVRHEGKAWIFVAAAEGFLPRAVTLLREAPDAVVATAELAPGARIAVKGVATLKAAWLGLGTGE